MQTIRGFKALIFSLIAMFLLSACGGTLQKWVDSNDNSNHSADDGPNHDNHEVQGESGGDNGSGGD